MPLAKQIAIGLGIDHLRQRPELAAMPRGQRYPVAVGMRTRQRHEVGLTKLAVRCGTQCIDDIGKRDATLELLGQHVAAAVSGWLKAEARNKRSRTCEVQQTRRVPQR